MKLFLVQFPYPGHHRLWEETRREESLLSSFLLPRHSGYSMNDFPNVARASFFNLRALDYPAGQTFFLTLANSEKKITSADPSDLLSSKYGGVIVFLVNHDLLSKSW